MRVQCTIKDVAKEAGFSIAVVSYVLNDTPGKTLPLQTREKVLAAVEKLNYTPNANARGMRMKKAWALGIVSFWGIREHVFAEILDGASKAADENNYTLTLCNLNNEEKGLNFVELYKRKLIDGIIFIAPSEFKKGFDENMYVKVIKENRIPAVILNGYTKDEKMDYIYLDYYQSSFIAVEYLISLGHKAIGYLLPDIIEMDQIQAMERKKGYLDAMKENYIVVQEEFIFDFTQTKQIIKNIKDGQGPTAIIANKCSYAQKLLGLFYENGISIPKDVSLMACNTEPYAEYLLPSLTSTRLPLQEMGEIGAKTLIDCIDNKPSQISQKPECSIAQRKSTMRYIKGK